MTFTKNCSLILNIICKCFIHIAFVNLSITFLSIFSQLAQNKERRLTTLLYTFFFLQWQEIEGSFECDLCDMFINIFKMRRQAYYLPNLNSLLAHHRQQLRHQKRLKQATSQYHQEHSGKQQTEIKKQPTPYQKRQRREQLIENTRMSKAMEASNPTVASHVQKAHHDYSSLKERIRKFTTQGSAVTYKYKKSLQQLERRKQDQEQFWSQRAKDLQIKASQQDLNKEPANVQRAKTSNNDFNDVFYQDAASLSLLPASKRKLTGDHPRSLTPQNFRNVYGGKTEKIKLKTSKQSESSIDCRRRELTSNMSVLVDGRKEARSRYLSDLYTTINKSIRDIMLNKASRTLNPEIHHKSNAKTLSDLQVISITPIS